MALYEDDEIGMAGADERHNKKQCELATYLSTYLAIKKKYANNYTVYTQEPVKEDRNSKIPDVCIKEAKTKKCVLLIEITNNLSTEIKKAKEYREEGIKAEIFVYEYIKEKWYKADENGDLQENESKSDIFKLKIANTMKKTLLEFIRKLVFGF